MSPQAGPSWKILLGIGLLFVSGILSTMAKQDKCTLYRRAGFRSYNNIFSESRCCGGQPVHYRAVASRYSECAVAPEDPQLSAYDSHWLFFHCLVSKALNSSEPLNLTSFGDVMTRGLPDDKRADILSILANQTDPTLYNNNHTFDTEMGAKVESTMSQKIYRSGRWRQLKKFWSLYFVAEFQICKTPEDVGGHVWAPELVLSRPDIFLPDLAAYVPDQIKRPGFMLLVAIKCPPFFKKYEALTNMSSFFHCSMIQACGSMVLGAFGNETSTQLPFTYNMILSFIEELLPSFWTPASRQSALRLFPTTLERELDYEDRARRGIREVMQRYSSNVNSWSLPKSLREARRHADQILDELNVYDVSDDYIHILMIQPIMAAVGELVNLVPFVEWETIQNKSSLPAPN